MEHRQLNAVKSNKKEDDTTYQHPPSKNYLLLNQ